MAQIDRGQVRQLALIRSMIPADVAKSIDAEELADRLSAAARLLDRATSADSPTLGRCYTDEAKALLKAQPRSRTKETIRDLMVKSAQAGSVDDREYWRTQAEQVKTQHPMAPRRRPPTVRKAAKAADVKGMFACYDADGTLIGLCDPAEIQPVVNAREATAKAARVRRPVR